MIRRNYYFKEIKMGKLTIDITHPHLIKEWHPTKNGDLKPDSFTFGSCKKFWWICEHGHEWQASINKRSRKERPTGCPVCFSINGRSRVRTDKNLAVDYPEIAKQWHPTKNGDLKPTDVSYGSMKKVWWQCENGHEWQSKIYPRIYRKGRDKCKYCRKLSVSKDYNLQITHPQHAKVWHPTKNGDLKPTDVTYGGKLEAWWKCENGHEWQEIIWNKTMSKNVCKRCSKSIISEHYNLEITRPDLIKLWHPTKNGNLKPTDVTHSSTVKVWWKCENGHEWQTKISSKTRSSTKCKYCRNLCSVPQTNLSTTHPHLVKEWHPTKNGDLKPENVTYGSNRKVWWVCSDGHEWQATINKRTRKGKEKPTGCPRCSFFRIKKRKKELCKRKMERNLKLLQHQIRKEVNDE
jgi:translation initiation factor IF-1